MLSVRLGCDVAFLLLTCAFPSVLGLSSVLVVWLVAPSYPPLVARWGCGGGLGRRWSGCCLRAAASPPCASMGLSKWMFSQFFWDHCFLSFECKIGHL